MNRRRASFARRRADHRSEATATSAAGNHTKARIRHMLMQPTGEAP